MALVTDSFCERCGTKYVFQAPAARALSLKNARVLARGLRNFVMNDGQSFEDSLHAARHEDSSADSSRLTQAFHRAFNFCMSCRQYACEQCWNVKAGACLTCAPLASSTPNPEHDHLIARMPVTRLDVEPVAPENVPPAQPLPTQASYAGPAAFGGPASSGGTASFTAGRLMSEPPSEPEQVLPAWPESDRALPEVEPAVAEADGSIFDFQTDAPKPAGRAPEWLLRRGSVDGESSEQIQANRSWPISDPLAPEATLTPEELFLVEAQLLRPDGELAEESLAAAAELPVESAQPAVPAEALPMPLEPERFVEIVREPLIEAVAPAPVAPELIVAAAAAVETPASTGATESPLPAAFMALRGTPSNGIWPHPTRWIERPKKNYSPIFSDELLAEAPFAVDETAAGVVDQAVAMPANQEVLATAAAPATEQTVAEATPVEEPAWMPEPPAAAPQPEPIREVPVGVAWQQRLMAAQAGARADAARAEAERAEAARAEAERAEAARAEAERIAIERSVLRPIVPAQVPAAPIPAPRPVPQPITPAPQPITPPPAVLRQPEPALQPTAQQQQPVPGWPPLGAQYPAPASSGPVWPAPAGVATPAAMLTPRAEATTEMWAQSAQEVMNRGTVRVCHQCSLPLSTHARFCRRCGTSQS